MPSLNTETLSAFGRVALKLDVDFSELKRLSGQIERLDIDSDSGLEYAVKLLTQFAQHGQNITDGIQDFSKALQDAREESEMAAKLVSERAQLVQQRKQAQDQMQEKLGHLGQKVKEVTESLKSFSDQEKDQLPTRLHALDAHLAEFIEEAQSIKEEASRSNLKGIERNAQSLFGTLNSARQKLNSASGLI